MSGLNLHTLRTCSLALLIALCWIAVDRGAARADVSAANVTVSNTQVGATAQYNIQFTSNFFLEGEADTPGTRADEINIVLPAGTVTNITTASQVQINGITPNHVAVNGLALNIRLQRNVNAGSITVVLENPPGTINPLTSGSYTLEVSTTQEQTLVESNAYSITSTANLTSATVIPTSSVISQPSGYRLTFKLGGTGALSAPGGTFTIVYPNDTTVPDGQMYGVTVNGTPTVAQGTSGTRTVQVQTPISLANEEDVEIDFSASSGLINPTTAQTYTLDLSTSVETTPVTSNAYSLFSGLTLAPPSVLLTPSTVNAAAQYEIASKVGTSGGLTANADTLYMIFPDNTIVPGLISTSEVIVNNGVFPANAAAVLTNPTERSVRVVPSTSIADGADVTITIQSDGDITNPTLEQNHTLEFATSQEDTVTSNAYLTTAATTTITQPLVTLSNSGVNNNSDYTFTFNVGAQGRLLGGTSTVTMIFPPGTTLRTPISQNNIEFNGVNSAGVVWDVPTRTITATVPASVNIGNNDQVVLFVDNEIRNPNSNTTVTATLNTSVENTQVLSETYQIGTGGTHHNFLSVTQGDNTVNTVSSYTLTWRQQSGAGVNVGELITLGFPANTTIPASMNASDFRIDPAGGNPPLAPLSVVANPTEREIDLESPYNLPLNQTHTIQVFVGAGVINPSIPASTYRMEIRTTDASVEDSSPTYTVAASNTPVTFPPPPPPHVTVAPDRELQVGAYTINFETGAPGALLAGQSTMTFTFPSGTTIPASMNGSAILVNGILVSTVTTNPGSDEVTVTTPVNIAGNEAVNVIFTTAAGIINAAASTTHTLDLITMAQIGVATSNTFTITPTTDLVVQSVIPDPTAINANAGYVIQFQIGSTSPLSIGDQITIDFPDATTVPGVMAAGDVRVNGTPATIAPFTDTVSKQVIVTTPVAVAGNGVVNLAFTNAAGLMNPPTATNYTLEVATNIQPTLRTSPAYTITAATTTVTPAQVTPSVGVINQIATYTIDFNVGGQGALQAGSSTITIVFNDSTTIPSSFQTNNVTVNGINPPTVNVTGQTVTITVPNGVDIKNNDAVSVVLGSATAVITNPGTAADYTVTVNTDVETTAITSLPYPIGTVTTTVTQATVTPSPNTVDDLAQYTFDFNVGGSGALTAGSSTITMIFPDNTTIPFSMSAADITVNGTPVVITPTTTPLARQVEFTTPVAIANDGVVQVIFDINAGIRNPSTASSYTAKVHTSVEQTKVTTNAYTIVAPLTTVTPANVTPNPSGVNTASEYTIGFRVGGSGALQAGVSTITLTMPTGTVVPASIATSKLTVNGANASAVVTSGQQIIITIPSTATIGNNDSVTVVIAEEALMINPQIQGAYTLDVETSAEPTMVASNPYNITAASTTVTPATVNPNPATISVASAYTVQFDVGSSGALQAGASTITLTLNNSTTVSTQTISGATINGVSAQAVSDGASRTVVLTVPPSVTVGNNGAVEIFLPSDVLTNPDTATDYTLEVQTSVEPTNVTSNPYTIGTASSTITITNVNLFGQDQANDTNSRHQVHFNTGAEGALTASVGTITVIFPDNTIVPASIATNRIRVNIGAGQVNVIGPVVIDTNLRTVTFTVPENIPANHNNVRVNFRTGAGLTNPSAGNYTLQARTSSEPTNVTSPTYAVLAAATTVSAATVSVSPNIIETNAAYTVNFSTGNRGRLLDGVSTITVTFPAGTTVPASVTPSTVTVNGVAASVVNTSGQEVIVTVPNGVLINNNSTAVIVFNTGAGLFNPPTVQSYTVDVRTDTETTDVTSNTYDIIASPTTVTTATVIPNPGTQLVNAQYTFSFDTGGQGALQGGVSTITTTFPAGTTVPGSIVASNVTVNGVASANVSTVPASRTVTTTVPLGVSIGNNDNVILIIGTSSNVITNPVTNNYTAQVRTSVEATDVTTNSYFISNITSTVDSAFVGPTFEGTSPPGGPSPQTVNTQAVYNVKFKLGAQGGLTAGSSQITVTFPENTTVPTSMTASLVTVNSTTVTAPPLTNASLRTVTVTVPVGTPNIANDDTVQVNFALAAGLWNPSLSGTYRLQVRTSVEATNIPSKLYTILDATTLVTDATVTPTPDEFGLNAEYRFDFSVGAQGALVAGVSTITFTFPSNTIIPSVITPSTVTINGEQATTVVADSVNREATVTVPASVDIGNGGSVAAIFDKDSEIINPDPAGYQADVRTSVEKTNRKTKNYNIKNVATIQQQNKISLYPRWSPSDKRIAYITESPDDESGKDTGNWNLYTIRKNGRQKTQVTSAISGGTIEDGDPIHFSSLTWTPDGDSLVYVGYERVIIPPDTFVTIQLFQISRNGGTFKKISPSGAVEDTLQQFGGWLDPDWKLTMFDFETAEFPGGVHRIVASIDGNIWAFEPRNGDDGLGSTFKGLVQLTNLPTALGKTDGLFQPKWSPDGTQLVVAYKDSADATLSDIYVISDVDSIFQKTLESPNYSRQSFDYDTEIGTHAVNDLGDMTKITPVSNSLPAWTPSWSTDGTQISYSQDQADAFSLDTFETSPANSVVSTNFYVKLRNSDGTGPDSTVIGVSQANNAFPTMSHNGQRFGYFQAATTGPFQQKQKVYYLQTTGKFDPPATPKVLTKAGTVIWKLADLGYSSMEFPVTAVNREVEFFILEPEEIPSEDFTDGRYLDVARTFGPADVTFSDQVIVSVHYTDGEFNDVGLVSGSDQEDRLGLYIWDTETLTWEAVENSTVDPARNLVSAPVTKLGTFGIFYQNPGVGQLFSMSMLYPNPFRPNSGNTNDGDYNTGVIFDLLPTGLSRLDIYNIAGEWVASLGSSAFEAISSTQLRWRVTNDNGRRVASGIYIYVMEAVNSQGDTERKMGKIGVIR